MRQHLECTQITINGGLDTANPTITAPARNR